MGSQTEPTYSSVLENFGGSGAPSRYIAPVRRYKNLPTFFWDSLPFNVIVGEFWQDANNYTYRVCLSYAQRYVYVIHSAYIKFAGVGVEYTFPTELEKYPISTIECDSSELEQLYAYMNNLGYQYYDTGVAVVDNGAVTCSVKKFHDYCCRYSEYLQIVKGFNSEAIVIPVEQMYIDESNNVMDKVGDLFPEVRNFNLESLNGKGVYIPMGFKIDFVVCNEFWQEYPGWEHYCLIKQSVALDRASRQGGMLIETIPVVGQPIKKTIDAYAETMYWLYYAPIAFLATRSDMPGVHYVPVIEKKIANEFGAKMGIANACRPFIEHYKYAQLYQASYEALLDQMSARRSENMKTNVGNEVQKQLQSEGYNVSLKPIDDEDVPFKEYDEDTGPVEDTKADYLAWQKEQRKYKKINEQRDW